MNPNPTTVKELIDQTARLKQELERLIAVYPESDLPTESRIVARILSLKWRHEQGQVYAPFDARYVESASWADNFRKYLVLVENFVRFELQEPERLNLLPLAENRSECAVELVEFLTTQTRVLEKWDFAFWRGLAQRFEELQKRGDFKLLWRERSDKSGKRFSWPRAMDDDLKMRFEALAMEASRGLGGSSLDSWVDLLSATEHDRSGRAFGGKTATLEHVVFRSASVCRNFDRDHLSSHQLPALPDEPAAVRQPSTQDAAEALLSEKRTAWLVAKLDGRNWSDLTGAGTVARNSLLSYRKGKYVKPSTRSGIALGLTKMGIKCLFSEVPE